MSISQQRDQWEGNYKHRGMPFPAAGGRRDGSRKFTRGKLLARRLMQDDQDYHYNDEFYRKHEDVPSPGIGH